MARRPKTPREIEALTHDEAARKNIPTAEMQPIAEEVERHQPFAPVSYPRARPLAEGEHRPRNADLDPQIIWKGTTLRLSPAQLRELNETGRLELGDAQLVWRGKDEQDWSDLVTPVPPIYVQEKIHPKYIIEALRSQTRERRENGADAPDLFADFNGLDLEARTEFYQHDQHWTNRFILGDSLQVMASLAEREALRGKVQCIYFDPPYGIKFNSNWQVSTRSRDVKDGKRDQITREPEQVKAFRDTWKDGIHSYLTYLRDRLTVMRDLLTESGSIFVQIGDENVHRVRALMDEVFGEENFISAIQFKKTGFASSKFLPNVFDTVLWYGRTKNTKFRKMYRFRSLDECDPQFFDTIETRLFERRQLNKIEKSDLHRIPDGAELLARNPLVSPGPSTTSSGPMILEGNVYSCPVGAHWKTTPDKMEILKRANRLIRKGNVLRMVRYLRDNQIIPFTNTWLDTGVGGFVGDDKVYVVQTDSRTIERCILMATDPGDLVLDPTCGSGTTATVAEQWGRRWITIDTSRVALALARARIMGARYPYYLLADSPEGRRKEAEITGKIQPDTPTHGDIRQGFVYERAPHITLKSIANNAEIDVIWENYEKQLKPLREALTRLLPSGWLEQFRAHQNYDVEVPPEIQEWEIARDPVLPWPAEAVKAFEKIRSLKTEATKCKHLKKLNEILGRDYTLDDLPEHAGDPLPQDAITLHEKFWELRIARQKEIDESIARNADVELLYDRPYVDNSKVRVAGPFTVESLSPHRVISPDEATLGDEMNAAHGRRARSGGPADTFVKAILENLKNSGVHQAKRDDRIEFTSIEGWPGDYIAAEGRFAEDGGERRAAIFIGPEYGTVSRADLVAAAREAAEGRFDVLIACGFNFDAHSSELNKLGPLPILKAKMNPDLHMAGELKNTGSGNLFVIFGEPDIEWRFNEDGEIVVEVLGVDVFDPGKGEVRAAGKDEIAAWFIDTDYNEESFFVRHAYFLGASDPYKSLKTALKDEIDKEAWETLYRDTSRPFPKPETGRFAVKVINHFGDEVMKVYEV